MRNAIPTLLVVTGILAAGRVTAAEPPDIRNLYGMGDVRYHAFQSQQLERGLHVFVRLPEDYDDEASPGYPTVYLLDGGITFPLFAAYYRYLRLAEELPDAIIVGISYGTEDWRKGNLRGTDFTAPAETREHWGGAERFARALEKELLPMIEGRYRADASRRVLFGQSLGGQFVLYCALTTPSLFWGHIASNPALHANLPFFLEPPQAPPGRDVDARLFVSSAAGDEPRFREPALEWIEHWSARERTPWRLKTVTLEGHGHFSAAPAAFRAGMRWLLETDER